MKLEKLVLCGFKSFADRTEFDFDQGASCIVGPNGCGKSNVVDAIKWVLGEQSAKSLRGSEMMDVIFNGSATRRPSGHAEVTMVFDNRGGLLKPPGDGQEPAETVSITRRLFRSGSSEYLINKTPARLRDIREMFLDTGVGVDAYSVIEQGRVEGFLQASQEDRRSVFDEAAGISKYKARKKEALRKLERVDQNLLRVQDIFQEIQKRLRSIKYQAGKARSYQSYTEQLKALRSLHLLAQYHGLSGARTDVQGRLDAQNDALAALGARIEQLESSRSATEAESADLERSAREVQGRMSSASAAIAACQQRSEMLASRAKELGEQIVAGSSRCEELEAKLADSLVALQDRQKHMEELEAQTTDLSASHDSLRKQHTQGELDITQLGARLEDEKAGTIDLFRRTAALHNTIHGLGIRRENLASQKTRLSGRSSQIDQTLQGILTERASLETRLQEIRRLLADSQSRLDQTRIAARRMHDGEQELLGRLGEAREQRSSIQGRLKALGEMQQRLEGVTAGVKKVLEAKAKGRLPSIVGMLGDFVQTDLEHAPLVEASLAGNEEQLLAPSFANARAQEAELAEVLGEGGAIEILCLDRMGALGNDFDLSLCPQAMGRVIDHVRCDAWLAPALWRLLGKTVVVRDLSDAMAAASVCPADYRFVTLSGAVLEPDGCLRLGAANRSAGVVLRRSELAELDHRDGRLQELIDQLQRQCAGAKSERQHLEEIQQKLRTAIYESNTEHVECASRLKQLNEQIAQLERERPLVAQEVKDLLGEIDSAVRQEHEAKANAAELEQLNAQRQKGIEELERTLAQARGRLAELSLQLTELKVALAQTQQKTLSMREALTSMARQRQQMEADFATGRADIDLARQRRSDAHDASARTSEELANLQAQQETLRTEAADLEESRSGLAAELEEIRNLLLDQRKGQEESSAHASRLRVELGEADVRIENLIARASEMHMNLPEAYASYRHEEGRDWQAVETEIKDLGDKIARLGNVNLDAIPEQEELQQREQFLAAQLADVHASKGQLEELIRRINKESRDMFARSFETVRANFQELFRKLFGGGRADIMLLDPQDVLESPIEIVARPPGKETRSLSLLSGGEKTMTALALLFSIFKSRPSPFCLLDEVDAALDEANNQRFNRLVSEFIAASQFIIISHSKRTMSMANVLYGVTMQEPGISKRISVRFEDAGKAIDQSLEPVEA